MKKLNCIYAFIVVIVCGLFCFTACNNTSSDNEHSSSSATSSLNNLSSSSTLASFTASSIVNENKEITAMYVYVNENRLEVTLVKNSSVDALVERLKKGDITYEAHDYGDFEKVGNIGFSLPANDEPTDTAAGDVILYQGTNICLYYGENSWDFTRIGRINGYSSAELRTIFQAGNGNIQVRLSLK